MSRRSFIRGAAALFGAGVAKARMAQAAMAPPTPRDFGHMFYQPGAQIASPDKRWDLFRELMRPTELQRERHRVTSTLLGGYPPHLASMHSCAPWFRAQRAAAWAQDRSDDMNAIERAIRRQVFGDD